MVWQLVGTVEQNAIIEGVLLRTNFPFERLREGLARETGKSAIPVEWADLSRYGQDAAAVTTHDHAVPAGDGHDHEHEENGLSHVHFTDENGEVGHGIAYRSRVLGLAWYSGKITMEQSLVDHPELAGEVFLAEGAHMVDFFYMTNDMRIAIWNAVHPEGQHIPAGTNIQDGVDLGHGHGWFDMATYREWVGEEFMGLFVRTFSDLPVTIPFAHGWDEDATDQVRRALLGEPEPAPQPEPIPPADPELTPEPEPTPDAPFHGLAKSKVFHDSHLGVAEEVTWSSVEEAVADGRRPCGVCKPN